MTAAQRARRACSGGARCRRRQRQRIALSPAARGVRWGSCAWQVLQSMRGRGARGGGRWWRAAGQTMRRANPRGAGARRRRRRRNACYGLGRRALQVALPG